METIIYIFRAVSVAAPAAYINDIYGFNMRWYRILLKCVRSHLIERCGCIINSIGIPEEVYVSIQPKYISIIENKIHYKHKTKYPLTNRLPIEKQSNAIEYHIPYYYK